MKKILFIATLFLGSFLFAGTVSAQETSGSKSNIVPYTSMLEISLKSAQLTQRLVKDYQCYGLGINKAMLRTEIKETSVNLHHLMQKFNTYVSGNNKVLRHLKMIQIAQKELEGIVTEKYSPDNMLLLMDLATVISESTESVVNAIERGAVVYRKDSNARMLRLSAL